jgi:excisionase family DNA binding protein
VARTPESLAVDLLTVADAAQHAGVSRHTVSSWITGGKLPAVRIAGRRYVRPADLAATQARAHARALVPVWRQDPLRAGKHQRAAGPDAGGQGRPAAAER